jgi:hypothetical protein
MDEFSQIFHPVEKLKIIREDEEGYFWALFAPQPSPSKTGRRFIYATGTITGWRLSISFCKKHSSKFFL